MKKIIRSTNRGCYKLLFVVSVLILSLCKCSESAYSCNSGSEFKVKTVFAKDQSQSSVATFEDGRFVVAWESYDQDGSGSDIYAQLFDDSGSKEGTVFRVNTVIANDQSQPSVATFEDGKFVVVWESDGQDGDSSGIYAQLFYADGTKKDSEFQNQDGGYGIYGQVFGADSTKKGTEFQANNSTTSNKQSSSVTTFQDGQFIITWESENQDGDGYGIFGQVFFADRTKKNQEFQVNSYTAQNQQSSSVAAFLMDLVKFLVVWQSKDQNGDGNGVYGRIFSEHQPAYVNIPLSDKSFHYRQNVLFNTTRTFSGSPNCTSVRVEEIKVRAQDDCQLGTEDIFTLEITNKHPLVNSPLGNHIFHYSKNFQFDFAEGTFVDPDNDTLYYEASLANGSPLPNWLDFDSTTQTFTGSPNCHFHGEFQIKVRAQDDCQLGAEDIFTLEVPNDPPIVNELMADQKIKSLERLDYTFSKYVFHSSLSQDELEFSTELVDGSKLPDWLVFYDKERRFSGTPSGGTRTLELVVTAKDGCQNSTSTTFQIQVTYSGCPLGMFSPLGEEIPPMSEADCENCQWGTYGDQIGLTACNMCPARTYNTETKKILLGACIKCQMGTYNPNLGSTTPNDCLPCSPGTYLNHTGGFSEDGCYLCDLAHYNPNIGSTSIQSCLPCPRGSYSAFKNLTSIDQCLLCKAGIYNDHTASTSCQQCPQGSQANSRQDGCELCPPGIKWESDNRKCHTCGVDEFNNQEGLTYCLKCSQTGICLGGNNCSTGRDPDMYCSKCISGYYLHGNGCSPCTRTTMVVILVLIIVFVFALMLVFRRKLSKLSNPIYMIFLLFFQLLGVIVESMKYEGNRSTFVAIPKYLSQLVNFKMGSVLAPECYSELTFYTQYFIFVFVLSAIILVLVIFSVVVHCCTTGLKSEKKVSYGTVLILARFLKIVGFNTWYEKRFSWIWEYYKPSRFWFELVLLLFRSVIVVVALLFTNNQTAQLLILVIILTIMILLVFFLRPYKGGESPRHVSEDVVLISSYIILLAVIILVWSTEFCLLMYTMGCSTMGYGIWKNWTKFRSGEWKDKRNLKKPLKKIINNPKKSSSSDLDDSDSDSDGSRDFDCLSDKLKPESNQNIQLKDYKDENEVEVEI
ncbi:insulin-like growth factor binding proteinn-terminal [Anaeramoeba flamelloides]|uniref:Insulin-like growth factor binding proteinn-terminal n=1 Tax=Anaeramoeba flamelloides TaxID=1746091 RepID=A0AAV8A2F9_9EUKA|nr:insulin-like growth factor binding proteinn-terminal [Anaeramoeba flamelloides]